MQVDKGKISASAMWGWLCKSQCWCGFRKSQRWCGVVRGWGVVWGAVFLGLGWICLLGAAPPAAQGRRGMVAADHILSSKAGVALLKQGGNAVDAACGATFVQGVVNPAGSGLGGGGFMLLKSPKHKQVVVIDFREVAPAASTASMYLHKGRDASRTGGLAVGVPGELRGCAYAVKTYGQLSLKQVLMPAYRLAKDGFPVGHHLAQTLQRKRRYLLKFRGLAEIFYPNGRPLRYGQRLRRPRLAKALLAIANGGPRVFYEGWIAKDIVAAVKRAGGILSLDDLKHYKIKLRQPLHTTYRGHQIYTMPPPSSGGVALLETLHILTHKKLSKMGHNSSQYLHFLSESMKHAFADRARFLGDPDFVKVPVKQLTSRKYAARLLRRIKAKVLSDIHAYGLRQATSRAAHRGGGTSHISVIDQAGFAVAITSTINTSFGSKVVASRSGIILNNEMDDFTTHPGKPNAYGLIQSQKNAIAPGKRPLSSMSPTLVLKGGRPVLSLGGSGGPTIITGTLQVLLNVLDFRLPLQAAVSRSRVHHQWLPPKLFVESDLPRDVRENLQRRGHRIVVFRHPFTAIQAVQRRGNLLFGASDPRKAGQAWGY